MVVATNRKSDVDGWMLIGRIRAAHGVRGEVDVEPWTDFPDRFARLKRVFLGDEHKEYGVDSARTRGRIFLTLTGVANRDDAAKLRGWEIWIPRDEAMPLPEGELYADEIIGLEVESTAGERLGTIAEIISTGANDVYVVMGTHGEVLVPAIGDVVKKIDVDNGTVTVEVVEGLLD